MKTYTVYILARRKNGTLYTGVTSNLLRRVWQHRNKVRAGFTQKYDVTHLVWYEAAVDAAGAIRREKQIKKWRRRWKLALIEEMNPNWDDLYPHLVGEG